MTEGGFWSLDKLLCTVICARQKHIFNIPESIKRAGDLQVTYVERPL